MVDTFILHIQDNGESFFEYLKANEINDIFIVCGRSSDSNRVKKALFSHINDEFNIVEFNDFTPNPTYESVRRGISAFRISGCRTILAIGGGSAIDLAKCIKLYAETEDDFAPGQPIKTNDICLMVLPTTAGSGSEATRFAVIYKDGVKQSITDNECIPSVIVYDEATLDSLPLYQKKATMLDSLCHAIESYWSIGSTDESKKYAKEAICLILKYKDQYISEENLDENKQHNEENTHYVNQIMFRASYLAGKAINITKTTAGHAMSYKLTTLYGFSHGHSVALCISRLWPFMINHIRNCVDMRGIDYLTACFNELADLWGADSPMDAAGEFAEMIAKYGFEAEMPEGPDFTVLVNSVNTERLGNNPVGLSKADIETIYRDIFSR